MASRDTILEEIKKVLKPPVDLAMLEEFADEIARRLAEHMPKPPIFVTKTIGPVTRSLRGNTTILESLKAGFLSELSLISTSPNFWIKVITDGVSRLDKTFESLQQRSAIYKWIVAVENNDGTYLLQLVNLKWLKECHVIISTTAPVSFEIHGKFDEIA